MLVDTRQKNIAQAFILERYFFVSICPAVIPCTCLSVFLAAVLPQGQGRQDHGVESLTHFLVGNAEDITEFVTRFDGEIARLIKEQFWTTACDIGGFEYKRFHVAVVIVIEVHFDVFYEFGQ